MHKFAVAKVHLMLYQLQKLSEQERLAVQQSPVWVTLLIACANHDIEESEIDRAKEIVHIKSFATQNDVKHLYKNLDGHIDQAIDDALRILPANGNDRLVLLEKYISDLNNILPKLDSTYASQLYDSLISLAISVAQSEGGVFGIKRISQDEKKYIHLPMLHKP